MEEPRLDPLLRERRIQVLWIGEDELSAGGKGDRVAVARIDHLPMRFHREEGAEHSQERELGDPRSRAAERDARHEVR